MSERRRMMMTGSKPELITDGLQFWFDGKNNVQGGGFNQSATTWYPYIKNSAIPNNYCLTKQGSGSWNSNGGFTTSGTYGYFKNTNNLSPFYYLPNVYDFTFVICLDNLIVENQICPVGGTYSSGKGTNRWRFYINPEYYIFTINVNNSWKDYMSARTLPTSTAIKTISFVRSGTNISVYINGVYDTVIAASSDYLGKISGVIFSLGSYDNNTATINVPYYSCQMYNRALSESEVVNAHKFITDRYGL